MKNAGKVVVPTLFALLAAIVFYSGWMFVFVFVAVTLGACVLGLALAVRTFFAKVASENAQVKTISPSQEELCPFSRAELIVEYLQVCRSPDFGACLLPYLIAHDFVLQVKGRLPNKKQLLDSPRHSPQHLDGAGKCLPVVFGRMVDAVLQQLIDYALRDYLALYLQGLCANPDQVTALLK
jgi:hypothetical protein